MNIFFRIKYLISLTKSTLLFYENFSGVLLISYYIKTASDCICNLNSPLLDIDITFDSDIYNIKYLHNKMFLSKCMHNLKLPY